MNEQNDLKVNGVLYRFLPRKCGKPGCKCNIPGQEHGPYWYAFTDMGTKYVGAKLPKEITDHLELLKKSKAKIQKIHRDLESRRDKLEVQVDLLNEQIDTLENLIAGEYTASTVLIELGLAQFNGHGG